MSGCWPEWYRRARVELDAGVIEVPGPGDNPRILDYLAAVPAGQLDDALRREDATPWCGGFTTWAMVAPAAHGFDADAPRWKPPPWPARARSWLRWGQAIEEPPEGSVVVLQRGGGSQPGPDVLDAPGHVGFLADRYADELLLLGGNQGDRVSLRTYHVSRLLGYRWAGE